MNDYTVLKNKIRQKMNEIADDLALGSARDYSQYMHMTGMIAGLAMIERDILDIEDRYREDE